MIESPLLQQFQGYINGRWTSADSGETLNVINPATGALLAKVPNMGGEEANRAVAAARDVLQQTPSLTTRVQWLRDIHEVLGAEREEIGRILTMEHGKPLKQAQAEVDYAAGFFRYFAGALDSLEPHTLGEEPKDCTWTVYHRPVGVAALISPWNFPIAMQAKKLAAAIAAGCAPVVKPSSKTPLTMIAFFELLERDLPACARHLQLLVGDAGAIGDALCENAGVAMISFTGSTKVGRHLMRKAAQHVQKVALELGGNAPFIVFADADIGEAVTALVGNKFRGSGQTCVCANRVLVQSSIAEQFNRQLHEALGKLKVGNGLHDDVDVGPLIDQSGYEKVRRHLVDALDKGANLAFGSEPGQLLKDWGAFFPPVMLTNVKPEMDCVRKENFGPLIPVMTFDSDREALTLANDTQAGLAAYFFTNDPTRIDTMLEKLRFGHVGVNTGTGPTPEAPFGGMKTSGIGREGGMEGLMEFVELQTAAKKKN